MMSWSVWPSELREWQWHLFIVWQRPWFKVCRQWQHRRGLALVASDDGLARWLVRMGDCWARANVEGLKHRDAGVVLLSTGMGGCNQLFNLPLHGSHDKMSVYYGDERIQEVVSGRIAHAVAVLESNRNGLQRGNEIFGVVARAALAQHAHNRPFVQGGIKRNDGAAPSLLSNSAQPLVRRH